MTLHCWDDPPGAVGFAREAEGPYLSHGTPPRKNITFEINLNLKNILTKYFDLFFRIQCNIFIYYLYSTFHVQQTPLCTTIPQGIDHIKLKFIP